MEFYFERVDTSSCQNVEPFSSNEDCSHNVGICSSTTECTYDGGNETRSAIEGVI